ncbi:hypothetical protein EVAR_3924_1 [Eumeta japonica]|uniref:Uncharacterized protein n=1 Tax=Eumeta variegata TaxID=151549 RepID=A0A4C1SQY8_EUMVA|nr:hypothetical protein EVAR_3924_1 [Eumeta japonica]
MNTDVSSLGIPLMENHSKDSLYAAKVIKMVIMIITVRYEDTKNTEIRQGTKRLSKREKGAKGDFFANIVHEAYSDKMTTVKTAMVVFLANKTMTELSDSFPRGRASSFVLLRHMRAVTAVTALRADRRPPNDLPHNVFSITDVVVGDANEKYRSVNTWYVPIKLSAIFSKG